MMFIFGLNFRAGNITLAKSQMHTIFANIPYYSIMSFELGNEVGAAAAAVAVVAVRVSALRYFHFFCGMASNYTSLVVAAAWLGVRKGSSYRLGLYPFLRMHGNITNGCHQGGSLAASNNSHSTCQTHVTATTPRSRVPPSAHLSIYQHLQFEYNLFLVLLQLFAGLPRYCHSCSPTSMTTSMARRLGSTSPAVT